MSPRRKLFVEENWVFVSLIASLTDREISSTPVWFEVQLIKNCKFNFFKFDMIYLVDCTCEFFSFCNLNEELYKGPLSTTYKEVREIETLNFLESWSKPPLTINTVVIMQIKVACPNLKVTNEEFKG